MNGVGYGITPFMGTHGILARSSGGGVVPFTNTYSMSFDGVDEYFNVADNDNLSFGNGTTDSPFSISAWVKMTDATRFRIMFKGDNTTGNNEYGFFCDASDRIIFRLYDSLLITYVSRQYSVALTSFQGQWIHLVGTYDGQGGSTAYNGLKIYLNGSRVDDTSLSAGSYVAMENGNAPLEIGKVLTNFSNGLIDETAIFNSELSASEVTAIYNSGVPTSLSSYPSLVSWWRMGDGDTWGGSSWTLTDNGSGGNNATSVNMEEEDRLPISPNSYSLNSFSFDGVDEYMNMAFTNTSTTGTISVWVKPTNYTTGSQSMCIYTSGGYRDYIMLHSQNTGGIRVVSADNGVTQWDIRTNTGHLTNGVWTHICFVFNGTSGTFYINGNSVPATYFNTTNTSYWWDDLLPTQQKLGVFEVNGYTTSLRYNGSIDEVAIWDNDQSANISTIFNNGVPQDISSLSPISNLRMGESATWNGSSWTLTDQGSGGNDATSVNMEEADKTGDQAYVI